MDRNAGDGADSAEDSGSSQSYPSTLPGIPKARKFFIFHHVINRTYLGNLMIDIHYAALIG